MKNTREPDARRTLRLAGLSAGPDESKIVTESRNQATREQTKSRITWPARDYARDAIIHRHSQGRRASFGNFGTMPRQPDRKAALIDAASYISRVDIGLWISTSALYSAGKHSYAKDAQNQIAFALLRSSPLAQLIERFPARFRLRVSVETNKSCARHFCLPPLVLRECQN